MMLSGLVTGTLGYGLKREFLANALALREVETFNYEIYSIDFGSYSASVIQQKIKDEFSQRYSGDINVDLFSTQNSFAYPSDSLRAARYSVSVEVRKPVVGLASMMPELASSYYKGLDAAFLTGYGEDLADFKESFGFATNANGNREFSHDLSFGLKSGWGVDSATATGRKAYAQQIASGIFSKDYQTTFGIATLSGIVSSIADTAQYRNFYTETYDLFKNTYSFSRKREILPLDSGNVLVGLATSINLNMDGTTDVVEKGTIQGKIDFTSTKAGMESYISTSFSRCSGIYAQYYTSNIMLQDSQYAGLNWSALLPLINTPLRVIRTYDARSLYCGYEVSYTNNPIFSGDATTTTQSLEFNIESYNLIEATHSYEYTVNRIVNNSGYFVTLLNNTTGNTQSLMQNYYTNNFPTIASEYPSFNQVKAMVSWPNVKTKSAARFSYSNNPSYFVTYDSVFFRVLDYTVANRKPVDIVNEYKIVNKPSKTSALSYGYQTERGEVEIALKISLGKQYNVFYPDGVGNFTSINPPNSLQTYLQAIYKLGGEILMKEFDFYTMALNWFLSDTKFNLDSDGNLNVQLTYVYTFKKRVGTNTP